MASKHKYNSSSDALLHPAKNAVFFEEWTSEDTKNPGLLCAEMSRLAYASQDVVRRSLAQIEFSEVEHIGGEDAKNRLASQGTQGFLAHNPSFSLTVLAFRGTESDKFEDLLTDSKARQKELPEHAGCLVHTGFSDCFGCVSDRVSRLPAKRKGTLLITGHSLGAALATLAAIDLKPDALITFGSPLVGNEKLGSLFTGIKVRRYVNCCDLVARVPPERLDRDHVSQLLTELADLEETGPFHTLARRAIEGTAAAIAATFDSFRVTPEFKLVARAHYVDRNGTLQPDISDEARRQDQDTARRAYRRPTHVGSVPIRDLADHAPINYVSAFTGRL